MSRRLRHRTTSRRLRPALGDVEEAAAEDLVQEAEDHIEKGRSLWRRRRFDFGPWRQEAAAADLVYEAVEADLVREAAEDLVQEGAAVDLVQKATATG
jgi:hypothetical protein